jgi:ferredoxin
MKRFIPLFLLTIILFGSPQQYQIDIANSDGANIQYTTQNKINSRRNILSSIKNRFVYKTKRDYNRNILPLFRDNLISKSIFSKSIDKSLCTFCKDCVNNCPTNALTTDSKYIFFEAYKCVDCNNCKCDAITKVDMNRDELFHKKLLIEVDYIICKECRNAFIGSDDICSSCKILKEMNLI